MSKIECPIEVSEIKVNPLYRNPNKPDGPFGGKCGAFVSVRPCEEKYKGKTFLGIMLGDLPYEVIISHDKKTKKLEISPFSNPAIFLPEFNEIVWGIKSWWETIEKEEDLHEITDKDIQNVWYVKALKAMQEKKNEE